MKGKESSVGAGHEGISLKVPAVQNMTAIH